MLGDLATGSAKLTVDVLKDGWVRVPVPAGLLVRDAQLDGKALSLVPGDKGKPGTHVAALLSHTGRAVLTLDVDVPVTSSTGEETLSLPSTDSGVTRAAVQLARQESNCASAVDCWRKNPKRQVTRNGWLMAGAMRL